MAETLTCDAPTSEQDETRSLVAPFELLRADEGDGLTLTGYAAVFNSPTRITGWEGDFTEVIAPGAFAHTIRNGRPIMQFDHGQHPLIGSLPVASIRKLKEDARGLYVEARVFDNWLTEPLRDAIRDQAISGMSFRFQVVKDSWDHSKDDSVRTLHEVRLFELGPVTFPAYSDTSVALRSLERAVPNIAIFRSSQAPGDASAEEPASIDPVDDQSVILNQLRARALRLRSTILKERT